MKTDLLYNEIRTPNMASDRSEDRIFDDNYSPDGGKTFPDLSVTKQSFAQECDINYIMKNNALINPLTPEQYASLNFVDLGTSIDYHSAKNYLIEAENSFMSLNAEIRARFDNNPGKFLDFVQDPSNQEALIQMGLATRSQNVSPSEVPTPSAQGDKPTPTPSEGA